MRYSWLAVAALLLWQATASAQQPQPQPQTQPQPQPAHPAQPQLGQVQPGTAQPAQGQPGQPQPGAGLAPQSPVVQPVPPPAVLDPTHDRLDWVLVQWEQQMKGIESLAAQCSRTTTDVVHDNKVTVFVGSAKYMRPNLAMLEMVRKDKPEQFEKFVCNGQHLYHYLPLQKRVQKKTLTQPKQGLPEDNFLSFLFGMSAAEAKSRYDLKLGKEDQFYYFIDITPKLEQDKADFERARIVLNKDSFMPRQLWFQEPANKNTVLWDVPQIQTKIALQKEEFLNPPVPKDWEVVSEPADPPQPRVVRPEKP
jgi:TIGR03009 family protein